MTPKKRTRLRAIREQLEWSRAKYSRKAELAPSTYGLVEDGLLVPYDVQLARIAAVARREAGWTGQDCELLEPDHA